MFFLVPFRASQMSSNVFPTPQRERKSSGTPRTPAGGRLALLHLPPAGLHISFFLSYVLNLSRSIRSMSMEIKTEWGR